jgi:hypothetical protein
VQLPVQLPVRSQAVSPVPAALSVSATPAPGRGPPAAAPPRQLTQRNTAP